MKTYQLLFSICLFIPVTVIQVAHAQSVSISVDVVGLNGNQSEAERATGDACTAIGSANTPTEAATDLLNTCAFLNELDDGDVVLAEGLDRLLPEEAFAISDTLTDASALQVTNVNARLHSLRTRQNAVAGQSEENDDSIATGGGAALPNLSNLELFVTGHISDGDVDGRRLQQDADLTASQITLGGDYRLSDNLIIGAGIGIFQNKTDFSTVAGDSEVEGTNLTLFGTFTRESLGYFDLVIDVGSNEFDLSRQINLNGNAQVMAVSNTDSSSVSVTAGYGKNFRFSEWSVGPYIRGGITRASVDGYSEQADSNQPGFGSTLRVDSQTIESTTLSVGATVMRVISTSRAVFIPQLSLEAELEADSDKEPLQAFLLADPNQQVFSVDAEERDTSYANLGIGGTAIFARGKSAFAYFETRLAHDFITQNWLKLGVRLEF